MSKRLLAGLVVLLLGTAGWSPAAHANTYTYAVKFVCGESSSKKIVLPGFYATAINVHNPNKEGAKMTKWFSEALPGERAGKVSRMLKAGLGPMEAFEVDCPEIMELLGSKGFAKGFATIVSTVRLNVTAVYTAGGKDGEVRSIDVETIEPSFIEGTAGGPGTSPPIGTK